MVETCNAEKLQESSLEERVPALEFLLEIF